MSDLALGSTHVVQSLVKRKSHSLEYMILFPFIRHTSHCSHGTESSEFVTVTSRRSDRAQPAIKGEQNIESGADNMAHRIATVSETIESNLAYHGYQPPLTFHFDATQPTGEPVRSLVVENVVRILYTSRAHKIN